MLLKDTHYFRILQAAAIAVFSGRAVQYLFWDAPYRALLWDETWIGPLVRKWGWTNWADYAASPQVNNGIQIAIQLTGIIYLFAAVGCIFLLNKNRLWAPVVVLGVLQLFFLAFLYWKSRFFQVGQFFEYSLQIGSPIFLLFWAKHPQHWRRLLPWMRLAIALTFTCHGLYALGFYPVPGNFMDMTMYILGLQDSQARELLRWAGWADLFLSILILLPVRWLMIPTLAYATLWGLATTLARVIGHWYPDFWWHTFTYWTHEALYRFPHFLIPLFVLLHTWQVGLHRQDFGHVEKVGVR